MEGKDYSEDLMGDRDYSKQLEEFLKEQQVDSRCTKEGNYYAVAVTTGSLFNNIKQIPVDVVDQFFRSKQVILEKIKEPGAK